MVDPNPRLTEETDRDRGDGRPKPPRDPERRADARPLTGSRHRPSTPSEASRRRRAARIASSTEVSRSVSAGSAKLRSGTMSFGPSGTVLTSAQAEKLVGVRHRRPAHDAVAVGLVVAHAPERRRVDVDRARGRRLAAGMAHSVDVGRVEDERAARPVDVRVLADPAIVVAGEVVLVELPSQTTTPPAERSWSWYPVACALDPA